MRIPTSNLSHNSLRSVLALGALTVAAAIAPASASAVAEVRVSTASNGTKTLRFSASDNERNAISVKFSSNEFEIREFGKGPQVNAGAGCTQVNTRTVRCARSGNFNIRLSLGRGNDIARLAVAGEDGSQNGHVPSLVFGGPGSDTLVGGAGDDTLEGGDVEDGSLDGGDSLNGRGGSDTLYGGPSGDSLVGGQGSDSVGYEATSSRNVVTIDGMRNDGADLNNDGFGEELDQVDTTVEQVRGGSGPDTMTAAATGSTLFGGPGNDVLIGRQDNDVLDGGRGRDDLRGGGEQDRLTNEGRTERLLLSNDDVANDGADANGDGTSEELDNVRADVENMTGGDGNDVLVGNGVRNFLNGFAGNDTIDGGGGEDVLDGERGSDRLLAGPGADTYNGDFPEGAVPTPDSDPPAPGIDTVDYGARTAPVRVMIGRPSGTTHDPDGQDANGDGVAEENDNVKRTIEVVIGGSANDILRAGEAGFGPPGGVVVGEPGNEGIPGAKLIGGPGTGSDTLIGDARADTLVGGLGPDDLRGGGSFDTASYKENTLPVLVSLDNVRNDGTDADGNGVAEEDDSVGLGGDVESIEGGSGNDLLVGNASRNILTGGLGADRLRGSPGPTSYVRTTVSRIPRSPAATATTQRRST